MAKFCVNCGAPIADGMRFCTSCGTPVEEQAQPAAYAQEQAQPVYAQDQPTQQPEQAYQQPEQAYQQPEQQSYQPYQAGQQSYQQPYQAEQQAYQPPYQQPYQPQGGYDQGYQPYQQPAAPAPKKKSKVGLIIGIVVGAIVLLVVLAIVLIASLAKRAINELDPSNPAVPSLPGIFGDLVPADPANPADPASPIAPPASGAETAYSAQTFFYREPIVTTQDGHTDYLYAVNGRHDVANYLTLITGSEFAVAADQYATTLLENGGVEYSMPSMYEFLIRVPDGVTYSETEPPVTLEYLDNNSITAAKWLTLGSEYNSNGINYCSNTPANLRSGCFIASQGRYFYFNDYTDTGKIYRMNLDTDETAAVVDSGNFGMDLGVAGDYLYYSVKYTSDSNRNIYRANVNEVSTELELFISDASDPQVYGEWLYYVDVTDDSYCRCRLDGSDKQKLITNRGFYTTVAYDKIYTCDYNGETGIHSFDLDGSNHQLVVTADSWGLSIHGGYLIFSTAPSSGGYIYRMDLDGTNQTLLSTIQTVSNSNNTTRIVSDGEYIYFNSADNELCMAPITGEGASVLTDNCVTAMVYETDDSFFFFFIDPDGNMYRFDLAAGEGVIW